MPFHMETKKTTTFAHAEPYMLGLRFRSGKWFMFVAPWTCKDLGLPLPKVYTRKPQSNLNPYIRKRFLSKSTTSDE